MPSQLIPDKKIGGLQFYHFPYLAVSVAFTPQTASEDLAPLIGLCIKNEKTAADFLQRLIDQGRKAGLQLFLDIANIESALPEAGRLTTAVLSLERWGDIYITPATVMVYRPAGLSGLFHPGST